MTYERATRVVDAPPGQIRRVLLDPRALPEWNPAIRTVDGPEHATTATLYPVTMRGGLRGHWQYTAVTDDLVGTAWQVRGLQETGTWSLRPHGQATLVVHEFRHEGPLGRLLANAFCGVAELRLDRLAERARRLAAT